MKRKQNVEVSFVLISICLAIFAASVESAEPTAKTSTQGVPGCWVNDESSPGDSVENRKCLRLSDETASNITVAYSIWKKPPVQQMKITLFNYKNWEQVKNGTDAKLKVEEAGPYVYSKILERVNINKEGDQISYKLRTQYKYVPSKSDADNDEVSVPNLPMLNIISQAANFGYLPQIALNQVIMVVGEQAFIKSKVKGFLWGYNDKLTEIAKNIVGPGKNDGGLFSLLENDTLSEQFTMNTGENDRTKKSLIEKVNGQSSLNKWNYPLCDQVEGSDGLIFPRSMLDKKQVLYVLFPDACRREPFVFDKEIEKEDGTKFYRYHWPGNAFDHPINYQCDCDANTCPPKGIFNVTACSKGPINSLSFPHFLSGADKLREDVSGLQPDVALHGTYIDIDPRLGVAVQGRIRFQLNIQVKKSDVYSVISYLPEGLILPVAWIELEWNDFCNCDPATDK